jgi:hypothetical protein
MILIILKEYFYSFKREMKRKNQLIQEPSRGDLEMHHAITKKLKLRLTDGPYIEQSSLFSSKTKRCSDEYNYDYSLGGASDEDECEYDRKKRLKINNGVIYTFQRTITKNKNNIPSYIN